MGELKFITVQNLTTEKQGITQLRISNQTELAGKIKDLEYINKFYIYDDPRKFREKSTESMPTEASMYFEILLQILESPVLVDGVPETPSNEKRKKVRKELRSIEVELYDLYEANLLQASNLANIFLLISEAQKELGIFSKNTMSRWEILRREFNGHKWITKIPERLKVLRFKLLKRLYGKNRKFVEHGLEPFRYKRLNNKKKLELALSIRRYVEDVLEEILLFYSITN